VGFISNLFHIYHSHICSFSGSWLIILKFVKSTRVPPSISPEAFAVFDTIIHCHLLAWEMFVLFFCILCLSALALGDLKDHCCYVGEEQNVWMPLQFSYISQHSSILGWISPRHQKQQSSSQEVYYIVI